MSAIGKIVKSNSHIDYVCQVYGPGEFNPQPEPEAYAFGTFVGIDRETEGRANPRLIGVIYNTLLMNPDFGTLGPRLSSRAELDVFSPDYLAETATLIGILAVGVVDEAGRVQQGVPMPAAAVNGPVRRLSEAEVRTFHTGPSGALMLHYAALLMRQGDPLIAPLLLNILDSVEKLFPNERSRLNVLRNTIAWRSIVQPAG
ncbi:MAG: hypothetical protein H6642_10240 [Caldilineaceae bacterium]|nr:hypothetical protein [Caldilineaceae bacterium]